MRNPFRRKKEMNVKEELQKMSDHLDEAWEKYDKNPSWRNALYLDELLKITERFIERVER